MVQARSKCRPEVQVTTLLQESDDMLNEGLQDIARAGNRAGEDALRARNLFKEYFCHFALVPWQHAHVRRVMFTE